MDRNLTVLIAEDTEDDAFLLKVIFQNLGFKNPVQIVTDGEEVGCESAARTISPSNTSSALRSPYCLRMELKDTSSPLCPNSHPSMSKGVASNSFAFRAT